MPQPSMRIVWTTFRGHQANGITEHRALEDDDLSLHGGQAERLPVEEFSPDTYVNLMDHYHPANQVRAGKYDEINRRISTQEHRQAFDDARRAGLWRFDQRRALRWLWA